MPLISEWSKYDHTKFNEKKPEKKVEIPQEAIDESADKTLKNTAEKMQIEPDIEQRREKALKLAKLYASELCHNNPEAEKRLEELEALKIKNRITIGEDLERLELEENPASYAPDYKITDSLSKAGERIKNILKHLFEPKKDIIKNSDRA